MTVFFAWDMWQIMNPVWEILTLRSSETCEWRYWEGSLDIKRGRVGWSPPLLCAVGWNHLSSKKGGNVLRLSMLWSYHLSKPESKAIFLLLQIPSICIWEHFENNNTRGEYLSAFEVLGSILSVFCIQINFTFTLWEIRVTSVFLIRKLKLREII